MKADIGLDAGDGLAVVKTAFVLAELSIVLLGFWFQNSELLEPPGSSFAKVDLDVCTAVTHHPFCMPFYLLPI